MTRILACLGILFSLPSNRSGTFRRSQLHPGTTGLGKTYGYYLLGRTRTMLTLSNVMHLLTNEFSGLCGRRLALTGVFAGSFNCLSFRHETKPPRCVCSQTKYLSGTEPSAIGASL